MSSPTISIFGGGIAGLTVAHELVQLGYEVDIYERFPVIGGLARSDRDPDSLCATEYSWRVFFYFYPNLLKLLKEIPISEKESKTVHDYLVPSHTSHFPHTLKDGNNLNNPIKFFKNNKAIMKKIWSFSTSCTDRAKLMDEQPFVTTNIYTNSKNESIFETSPQIYGLDKEYASSYSVLKIGVENLVLRVPKPTNYVLNKPTSEAWFTPWMKLLKSRGVRFHLEHELVSIKVNETKMKYGLVKNLKTGELIEIKSNYFVLNLPVQEVARLVQETPLLSQIDPQFSKIPELASKSAILQLCFQLHFDRPIYLDSQNGNGFTLIGSPWAIIIQTRETLFPSSHTPFCLNNSKVKGSWSILCGQDRVPGILYGKPFSECTEEEIQNELWAQILENESLMKAVQEVNGFPLSESYIVHWSPMWPTFSYDPQTGKLRTKEIKFSNNFGTLKLRPTCKTKWKNMFLASGYTIEGLDIYSMEAACMSGKTASYLISHSKKSKPFKEVNRPLFFAPFRMIDQVLFWLKLPNWSSYIMILLLLFFILFLLGIYKKKSNQLQKK